MKNGCLFNWLDVSNLLLYMAQLDLIMNEGLLNYCKKLLVLSRTDSDFS